MSPLLLLVVLVYFLVQGIEFALTFLNLRHLGLHGATVPAGFEDEVDGEVLRRMRDYTMARSRLSLVESLFGVGLTILFLFGGLLDSYNSWLAGFGYPQVAAGVLFFLLLSYAHTVINLPFGWFSTFSIEKRYGFNKQTVGLWLVDTLKGLLLSTVLSALLLGGAFWLIDRFPQSWWFFTWLFFLVFSVFMMYLAPYVIEPLFNKFSPIEDVELERKIRDLMERAGLSVSRVFTMDASRRSSHSNAYFSGIGHVKRIVLFDTLLSTNSHEEILAILAHEAGHWKKHHVIKRLVVMEMVALAGMYLFFVLARGEGLVDLFGLAQSTMYAKLLLAGFVISLTAYPFQPLMSSWSRRHEREADDFAVKITGSPQAMAASLVRLSSENLANLHPHPLYAAFHYSHPPMPERVARLLAMERK